MDHTSFDIKAFVESLDLTVGLFRLLRVEPTEAPEVVIAIAEVGMTAEQKTQMGNPDMSTPMWVVWMPKCGILRLHTNLDLGGDSLGEERLGILTDAVNHINCWAWDRVGKASVQKSDASDINIGRSAFSIFVPPPLFTSEEGMSALRLIVAANMARLYQEAAVTSIDLHTAMTNAGMPPEHMQASVAKN